MIVCYGFLPLLAPSLEVLWRGMEAIPMLSSSLKGMKKIQHPVWSLSFV